MSSSVGPPDRWWRRRARAVGGCSAWRSSAWSAPAPSPGPGRGRRRERRRRRGARSRPGGAPGRPHRLLLPDARLAVRGRGRHPGDHAGLAGARPLRGRPPCGRGCSASPPTSASTSSAARGRRSCRWTSGALAGHGRAYLRAARSPSGSSWCRTTWCCLRAATWPRWPRPATRSAWPSWPPSSTSAPAAGRAPSARRPRLALGGGRRSARDHDGGGEEQRSSGPAPRWPSANRPPAPDPTGCRARTAAAGPLRGGLRALRHRGLVALLHDATLSMPPHPLWVQPRADSTVVVRAPGGVWRGVGCAGTPADRPRGRVPPRPDGSRDPFALQVLDLEGGRIRDLTTFVGPGR